MKIDKVDGGTVRVTTSFEKNIKNRSKSARDKEGYYTVPDFSFSNGPSQILDCAIEYEDEKETQFDVANPTGTEFVAKTKRRFEIASGRSARIWGKATQYRRIDDVIYETFLTPAVDPVIEVILPDEFEHKVEFGTPGKVTKSAYAHRYTLSGVYFPGQYMFVRWWPKK